MSQPLLKCEHVDFGYENYDVVKDVSLEICQGELPLHRGRKRIGKEHADEGASGAFKAHRRKPYGIRRSEEVRHRISSPADARPRRIFRPQSRRW